MGNHYVSVKSFNKHKKNQDGLQNSCRNCYKKYLKKWRAKNPSYFIKKLPSWRKINPDYWKQPWAKAYSKNERHRRRALKRESDVTDEWLKQLLKMASMCPLTGVKMIDTHGKPNSKEIDHIVPLNMGGRQRKSNFQLLKAHLLRFVNI